MGDTQAIISAGKDILCLLYTSPSPRDRTRSRMSSSACKKKNIHNVIRRHVSFTLSHTVVIAVYALTYTTHGPVVAIVLHMLLSIVYSC